MKISERVLKTKRKRATVIFGRSSRLQACPPNPYRGRGRNEIDNLCYLWARLMTLLHKRCFPVALMLLLVACTTESSAETPITHLTGLYMAYGFSFDYDRCGDNAIGQKIRQALIAKMDICPFTQEARLELYKRLTLDMSQGLSNSYRPTSQTNTPPRTKAYCENPHHHAAVGLIQQKISEYDAGRITLPDILVHVKSRFGEPVTCTELAGTEELNGVRSEGAPMATALTHANNPSVK